MVALGLVLLVVGALVLVAGIFTTGDAGGGASILGVHLGTTSIFLLGVFAGVAIVWGLGITRFGGKRHLQQRKEKRHLQKMAARLEEMERSERKDGDEAP